MIVIPYILWLIFLPILEIEAKDIFQEHYGRFAKILVGLSFFWFIYYQWLWKIEWKWLRALFFDRPNLSGTWMGYLQSNYKKDGNLIPPIKIVLFIRQPNFFDIRITSQTKSYAGFSFGEVLQYDSSSQKIRLLYQYSQKKTVPDSADDQQGAADLHLYENYLAGHYWTIVKTSGFIRVHQLSEKQFKSFEEAEQTIGNDPVLEECYALVSGKHISDEQ